MSDDRRPSPPPPRPRGHLELHRPLGPLTPPEPRDRGRAVAFGVMGALVLLGLVLVARGSHGSLTPPALTSALVDDAGDPALALGERAGEADARPHDDTPRPPPVFRVASLESDAAVDVTDITVTRKHGTLSGALDEAKVGRADRASVLRAAKKERHARRLSVNDHVLIAKDKAKGALIAIEVVKSPLDVWQARVQEGEDLRFEKLDLFVEHRRVPTAVAVTGDLAKAVAAAGLHEDALSAIDDAVDGRSDLPPMKPGVRLRVIADEEWIEGAFTSTHVEAVEIVPRTGEPTRLYYYERDPDTPGNPRRRPRAGFYDDKGHQPFEGRFRMPIPLARITSRYNPRRMHPILHKVKAHNGVDFGAVTGTPVYASGEGTVIHSSGGGPCGNMVKIRHAHDLVTAYCHLSRFAKGLHNGQHVETRQLIGYVGQTGRATGPHLHFAAKRRGRFIDPMSLKLDGIRVLPPADREPFAKLRAELDKALDAIPLPAPAPAPPDTDEKDEPADDE